MSAAMTARDLAQMLCEQEGHQWSPWESAGDKRQRRLCHRCGSREGREAPDLPPGWRAVYDGSGFPIRLEWRE